MAVHETATVERTDAGTPHRGPSGGSSSVRPPQQSSSPSALSMPRRERKKRQTRNALIHAAFELFEVKGYEQTAIREITDAVDVSERTFFRYFTSKEDLVLSFVSDAKTALIEALAARPPEEEPLTALRRALRRSLEALAADGHMLSEPSYLSIIKLIDATPSLLAAQLRYSHEHSTDLVTALARREGVDPATDLRPRILAATFGALIFEANRDWRTEGGTSVDAMLAKFDAYADQFGSGLFGHWNTAAGDASQRSD